MTRESIIDQFSYRGDAGAIWEGFDQILDTQGYLNLGYSGSFETHLIGSPQQRLADHVATQLEQAGVSRGDRLLDVGCGRGGPPMLFNRQLGVRSLGIDLVPYNLQLARAAAMEVPRPPTFTLADATRLPICSHRLDCATAIDSIVYVDDLEQVLHELHRVLRPGSPAVITDLLIEDRTEPTEPALEDFAESWGFPTLRNVSTYRTHLEDVGFRITIEEDLSPNSVGRFRKWTSRYRRLRRGMTNTAIEAVGARLDLDLEAIDRQVARAHEALPHLEHRLFVVESGDAHDA